MWDISPPPTRHAKGSALVHTHMDACMDARARRHAAMQPSGLASQLASPCVPVNNRAAHATVMPRHATPHVPAKHTPHAVNR